MFNSDKPYTLDSVVRMVLSAGFIVSMIWLLGYLSSALIPFVTALLLAYLLNPLTDFIERKVNSRGIAVFATMLLTLITVAAVVMTVIPTMLAEFSHMGTVLKELANNKDYAQRVLEYIPPDLWDDLQAIIQDKDLQRVFTSDGALEMIQGTFDKLVPGIKGIVRGATSFATSIIGIAIVLLYMVFLLADFGRIKNNWQEYLPEDYRKGIVEFLDEFELTMSRYFRSQILIAFIVGVLLSIGFIIIGLPMALVLGMFAGMLNIAPYLTIIGLIPAIPLGALSAIEAGNSPWVGMALVLLVFGVVQAIQDGFLVPKIQGKSLGLSPWLILLALSVWGKLLGFLGLLIALPMTCLFLSYYRRLLAQRKQANS